MHGPPTMQEEPTINVHATSDVTVSPPVLPTEDEPAQGEISEYGVVVSQAVYWVEDGRYVIRSTEFDIAAEHENFDSAVQAFYETAEDYCLYLVDLIKEDQATDHEREIAAVLVPRLIQIWRESERRLHEAQKRIFNVRRPRRLGPDWRLQSTQKRSSQPSPA